MRRSPVCAQVRNKIGHLTLARPEGLNALNLPMVRQLSEQLHAWAIDAQVQAVVLRGSGEKAFCAGGDIRALHDSFKADDGEYLQFFEEEYALDQYLHAYPKPVLALLDGLVLGGGMGLGQAAALRVVTGRTRMAMPEVGIGYFPDVGASYFLARLPHAFGMYLALTGRQIGAADALYLGLADQHLSQDALSELDRCLDTMAWTTLPHEALRTLLATLASQPEMPGELAPLSEPIERVFSAPDIHALHAALSQETALSQWAVDTAALLDSRSPLALCVTFELLRRGRALPLADCFALELHLDRQWFAEGDIIEGVRALLIDKDKQPRWRYSSLAEVPAERVQAFFSAYKTTPAKHRRDNKRDSSCMTSN